MTAAAAMAEPLTSNDTTSNDLARQRVTGDDTAYCTAGRCTSMTYTAPRRISDRLLPPNPGQRAVVGIVDVDGQVGHQDRLAGTSFPCLLGVGAWLRGQCLVSGHTNSVAQDIGIV